MRAIIIILLAPILSGCATMHWENTINAKASIERDESECDYEAQKALASKTYFGSPISQGVSQGFDQARLISACLGARGWRRVPNG